MNSPYDNINLEDQDKHPTNRKDPIDIPERAVAGLESFRPILREDKTISIPFFAFDNDPDARMCHGGGQKRDTPLLVRTSDKKNFRVYMKANLWFNQSYTNRLCRFLDSRQPGESVTFILGTKMSDWQAHILGGVISSMLNCKAEVTTIVAGYCGICESMIWCFGKNRLVYRYGAMTFGHTEITKTCDAYKHYFDVFYARAVEVKVLTEEEAKDLRASGITKLLLSHEIIERIGGESSSS